MEKIDGSIVSSYGDGTREDFLFTYSEDEKEQHDLDKLNASLVLNPEFIPVYPKMLQNGYSLIEATVYGFIKFFLSNNQKFYCTDEQLASLLGCSEWSISKAIKRLKDDGLIDLTYRIKAGGGKIRFISLVPSCEIHSSEMGNSQGIENKIIENTTSIKEVVPPAVEYGNKFVNEFICTVQQIYVDCAMEREVDRREVVHWINRKTGEPTKNRKQYMDEHGYSTVYDMIRDLLERLKTMKYGHGWASRIDTLWNKKTDIMNGTRDYMKIGEKSHFDWYLNNIVGKVKFKDYDGEKLYTPAMYSKYLQLECGMDMLEAQELRDKFLSD